MGKGIVIPINIFVQRFKEEIKLENNQDELALVKEIVKKYIGDYDVCTLGHDAFQGRHGLVFEMFEDSANEKEAERITQLIKDSKLITETLPFTNIFCSSLIFIGHFEDITPNELSYYLKAPEVIYSIASFIPLIMKYYPFLMEKDCASLNVFDQQACIWTFAPDCSCCG